MVKIHNHKAKQQVTEASPVAKPQGAETSPVDQCAPAADPGQSFQGKPMEFRQGCQTHSMDKILFVTKNMGTPGSPCLKKKKKPAFSPHTTGKKLAHDCFISLFLILCFYSSWDSSAAQIYSLIAYHHVLKFLFFELSIHNLYTVPFFSPFWLLTVNSAGTFMVS